jgi:Bacteriocin-protection, YdeI or OmpD-Associated/Domain of unknown function (DUF1905)
MTAIEGTINGFPFQATLEPDGQKGHWLKVDRKLSKSAGADAGDIVTLEIATAGKDTEPEVPTDLRKTLAADPKARELWSDITPNARRDWIHWITSPKQPETRARRIKNACSMLTAGKRRVCCFDRSGFYSKSLSAPKAGFKRTLKVRRPLYSKNTTRCAGSPESAAYQRPSLIAQERKT